MPCFECFKRQTVGVVEAEINLTKLGTGRQVKDSAHAVLSWRSVFTPPSSLRVLVEPSTIALGRYSSPDHAEESRPHMMEAPCPLLHFIPVLGDRPALF
jgi:hypothetical protein